MARCGRLKTSELLSPYAEFELLDRLHVYPSIAAEFSATNYLETIDFTDIHEGIGVLAVFGNSRNNTILIVLCTCD